MENKTYTWKSKIFSTHYEVFDGTQSVGELKGKHFSEKWFGQMNDKSYNFLNRGFWKQKTQILDASSEECIGTITYNTWISQVTIILHGKEYSLKSGNFFRTKRSIEAPEKIHVNYSGSDVRVQIVSNTEVEPLLLSGLVVRSFLRQIVTFVVILVVGISSVPRLFLG